MTVSNIKARIPCDIHRVWQVVTSVEHYTWRSDLSKTELISDKQFIEYTKEDFTTTFTITVTEPYKRWEFDMERTQTALSKTLNITAYDNEMLVGCLRILTDGYFFGTITELLVLPKYQKQGVGSKLLELAKENTPTMLYFGSQPGVEMFYEKNGCRKSLQSYMIDNTN